MKVLISLPVYKREWILPLWFDRIEKQDIDLSDIGFSFLTAPYDEDKETHDILTDWSSNHPEVKRFVITYQDSIPHHHHEPGRRMWRSFDYSRMTIMRNQLLDIAVNLNPDYVFSLDSDILLDNQKTISELIKLTEPGMAVSPLMYMRHYGVEYPSVMSWYNGIIGGKGYRDIRSYPIGSVFQSDVIMAAVMMSKDVYTNARYHPHQQGEDLGWSADCAKRGYKLYSASHLYCPHIMHKSSADIKSISGPGILDVYLRSGDDRYLASVNNS